MSKLYYRLISLAVFLNKKDFRIYELLRDKPDNIIALTYKQLLETLNNENKYFIERYKLFYEEFLEEEDKRLHPEKYIFTKKI